METTNTAEIEFYQGLLYFRIIDDKPIMLFYPTHGDTPKGQRPVRIRYLSVFSDYYAKPYTGDSTEFGESGTNNIGEEVEFKKANLEDIVEFLKGWQFDTVLAAMSLQQWLDFRVKRFNPLLSDKEVEVLEEAVRLIINPPTR